MRFFRWRKNERGTAAVEFALVGFPALFMIIGIIEISLLYISQSLLQASTDEAARQIRTGAVQQGGGEAAFQETLCGFADFFIPCEDLQYNVVSMENFEDAEDLPEPDFDDDGNLTDQSFNAGGVSDVVMIRTAYAYPIKTPMMSLILSNTSNNKFVMMSTVVLQTEPYEFED